MPTFRYIVTIECEDEDDAETVIGERLGFDEDYGFEYTLDFEAATAPAPASTAWMANVTRDQLRDAIGTPGEED